MPRLLARLVLALMLVMGQGLAGQNRASANLARPDARIGTQVAYNQLSYHENLASAAESRVGYVLFGQAANYEAGNLIAQEEKANPNDPDWAEDGTYSLLLHGLIGAAQGAIAGGGATGSMIAGGAGAVAGTAITPLLASYLESNGVPQGSAEEKLLLSLASSAIGAGTGALTGGGATGAVTGSGTAAYSTTYNYLDHAQTEEKTKDQAALAACNANPGSCTAAQEAQYEADLASLNAIDQQTNDALFAACGASSGSAACDQQAAAFQASWKSLADAYTANHDSADLAEINDDNALYTAIQSSEYQIAYSSAAQMLGSSSLGAGAGAVTGATAAVALTISASGVAAGQAVIAACGSTPSCYALVATAALSDIQGSSPEFGGSGNPGTNLSQLLDLFSAASGGNAAAQATITTDENAGELVTPNTGGVGSAPDVGPWSNGITNYQAGATFTQCGEGSCVAATGQILTDGAVTESQLISQIGEWSNPEQLATALNAAQPGAGWVGGYFGSGEDALTVANSGEFGAVLQAPGAPAHMVTISPVVGSPGTFLVQDTGAGATYNVTSSWIEQYVAGGVYKP